MSDWAKNSTRRSSHLTRISTIGVLIVSGMYLVSFLILDVVLWKTCVVVLGIYGCLILHIGRRAAAGGRPDRRPPGRIPGVPRSPETRQPVAAFLPTMAGAARPRRYL